MCVFCFLWGVDQNPGSFSLHNLSPWIDGGFVEVLGHSQVKPWLYQTSVFVLPSYRDGLPRSTQEAMALGRPVITTNVPGCRETVVEGVIGFLVPPREVCGLARAMRCFVEQPQLIESMGRESRRLAVQRFDVRLANARLVEVMGI